MNYDVILLCWLKGCQTSKTSQTKVEGQAARVFRWILIWGWRLCRQLEQLGFRRGHGVCEKASEMNIIYAHSCIEVSEPIVMKHISTHYPYTNMPLNSFRNFCWPEYHDNLHVYILKGTLDRGALVFNYFFIKFSKCTGVHYVHFAGYKDCNNS